MDPEIRRTADDVLHASIPQALLLSNGRFGVLVSDAGAGGAIRGALAVTRWVPDRTRDADGVWLYLRDMDDGTTWSAGLQPVWTPPAHYEVCFRPGVVEMRREDAGIETRVSVCVPPDADVELRRITLENRSGRARRIEVTTYAELVLNTPAADVGHPAFSKLFVQTGHRAGDEALVAWRRLRSPDDEPLWVAARLVVGEGDAGALEYETDRMRFIGRGRTAARPAALDPEAALSGTVGNVLDPVLALRRAITLAPGATAELWSVLAAANDESVVALARQFASRAAVEGAFTAAADRARRTVEQAGLRDRWQEVPGLVGESLYLTMRNAWLPASDEQLLASIGGGVGSGTHADATRGGGMMLGHAEGGAIVFLGGAPRPPARPSLERITASLAEPAELPQRRSGPHTMPERLRFFNGYGGFSESGDEYVIRIPTRDRVQLRPPLPWTNVIANELTGCIVSESGAASTWSVNSRENRLTPWLNDPVTDPHAEALYLRDDESGAFWSPTPGPAPDEGAYEVRHGLGQSRWRHASAGVEQDVRMFVPRGDAVRLVHLTLTNVSGQPRRLSAYAYARLVLGSVPHQTAPTISTRAETNGDPAGVLLAVNSARGEFAHRVAVAAACGPPRSTVSWTTDRTSFLGRLGSTDAPAAVVSGDRLDGRTGPALDPCFAYRVEFDLAPGATAECVFILGEGESAETARALARRYAAPTAARAAADEMRAFWRHFVSGVRIDTPSPALDVMVNHWLPYQNLSCRIWGRSAFYQSGGAFGFRDQLQDVAGLLYLDPSITRRQILRHAQHQFIEGDVLHWWHPPTSKGIRTRFSDDLLWLPYVTDFYLGATGDESVLDEPVRFLRAPLLDPGEDERFLTPEESGESASIYEHCCRALDRSLTRGAHGLPLIGAGDWNDGMNRVGREGRGESVWLGFFLYEILAAWIPICRRRGDTARASTYGQYRASLYERLNATGAGWDGSWYRRAYYDDGTPIGSRESDECRIDVIAQAWSVLSGAAPPQRAAQVLDAVERELVSQGEGIIRLLTPAFDRTPYDPGYIKGYLPGVRENGGQYTHGALWAVRALAELGRCERAAALLEMLDPVTHAESPADAETYKAEPYVVAADVYGVAPHVGRAGWTWYTGSAGWMYRVALESILGVSLQGGDTLVLRPCIPDAWPGFTIRYRLPDGETTYEVVVRRGAAGAPTGVRPSTGTRAQVADGAVRVALTADGAHHRIEIALGGDVAPRYEERADA